MITLLAAIDWHSCFFLLFALLAAGFALGVLLSNNIVRMAANLIVSLSATAALFMLAGAEFVGAMQIMIYVGGTLVLLVFGVMLTAQASFISLKTRSGEWVMAILVGSALLFLLIQAAVSISDWSTVHVDRSGLAAAVSRVEAPLGLGFLGMRPDAAAGDASSRPAFRAGYLLPFEVISIHLLVVLVGAAYLARARYHKS